MHRLSTNFVLGYHGCDKGVADKLLNRSLFEPSRNDYDWLGEGVYFWEANPQRGLDFAIESAARRRKGPSSDLFTAESKPAVVGAVIELGHCLDLTTLGSIDMVESAFESLKNTFERAGKNLPKNGSELLLRRLDCAVINWLHSILALENTKLDSVRGVFIEGAPLFPSSGFYRKTHTQIAVRNLDCIKAVFRVPESQLTHWKPS